MNIDETLGEQTTRVSGGVDREAMHDELTEMFINYQQRLDEPMPPIGGVYTPCRINTAQTLYLGLGLGH